MVAKVLRKKIALSHINSSTILIVRSGKMKKLCKQNREGYLSAGRSGNLQVAI